MHVFTTGGGIVAEGRLLDLIRRLYCFGISLLKMDVRQESTRHTEAIDSITRSASPAYCLRLAERKEASLP